MNNHLWRPFYVVLVIIAFFLVLRYFLVPQDFGVHGVNFTYGYHRAGDIKDWQAVPVKYRGREFCTECHPDHEAANSSSKHASIQCENCHGPAFDHPEDPEKLIVDTSRDLCLRCHAALHTPSSQRSLITGIDSDTHNPKIPCRDCHNPHKPDLEDMQ